MVVEWNLPDPLPPGATGFAVYVNGEVKARVEGAGQRNVLLSEVPRHQVCAGSLSLCVWEGRGVCVCVRGWGEICCLSDIYVPECSVPMYRIFHC